MVLFRQTAIRENGRHDTLKETALTLHLEPALVEGERAGKNLKVVRFQDLLPTIVLAKISPEHCKD